MAIFTSVSEDFFLLMPLTTFELILAFVCVYPYYSYPSLNPESQSRLFIAVSAAADLQPEDGLADPPPPFLFSISMEAMCSSRTSSHLMRKKQNSFGRHDKNYSVVGAQNLLGSFFCCGYKSSDFFPSYESETMRK